MPVSRAVAIIGAGRMGQGLGLALLRQGYQVRLAARRSKRVAHGLRLVTGDPRPALEGAFVILLAVPDDQIEPVAYRLAALGAVSRSQVVLHLSGLCDRRMLAPLRTHAAGLGSFHPLQAIADPRHAAKRLKGAFAGIEGDRRAVAVASRLARALGMTPIRLRAAAKPAYHAGAVIAANYVAVLAAIAERLAVRAGIPARVARRMYRPLLLGAAANIGELGSQRALTGPVRRGDVRTVAAHLAALKGHDRKLYADLAREAVVIARRAGLASSGAQAVMKVLASHTAD
jgi:predicted short-subunit dehydrogenase-like oxidoreductase (DUF2520 family)